MAIRTSLRSSEYRGLADTPGVVLLLVGASRSLRSKRARDPCAIASITLLAPARPKPTAARVGLKQEPMSAFMYAPVMTSAVTNSR
jgi:hypothetical protein